MTRSSGRSLRREWRHPPRPERWYRRARWYDNGARSFRLVLMDEFRQRNVFLYSREEALRVWTAFTELAGSEPRLDPQKDRSIVERVYEQFAPKGGDASGDGSGDEDAGEAE